MSRPAVFNAFDEAMIAELDAAFAQLGEDADVRVIVLAGDGRHFSAGADLQWMQRASSASREWNLDDARRFAAMLARIEAVPKPTVARVQGAALGGGVGLACACDIAIAADDASFAVSEAKFGILPAVIGPYVVNAVGKRQAQAPGARRPRASAPPTRWRSAWCSRWCRSTSSTRRSTRSSPSCWPAARTPSARSSNSSPSSRSARSRAEVRELTAQTISRVRASDEAREGFAAFLAKRPPPWSPP